MTEQEYRAADGINKSTLWEMRRSPAHYRYLLDHPAEDTPALKLGRALHAAVLTPGIYRKTFAAAPDVDRRTKAGKEAWTAWRASLPSTVEELTAEEAQTVAEMARQVRRDPDAWALLKGTKRETPVFWHDRTAGLLCKCRIDAWGKDWLVDLKTAADDMAFERDAFNYGYHVQAAHYLRGAESRTGRLPKWFFIVIEKKPPYGIRVVEAEPGFIDYGEFVRQGLLEKVRACRESGVWPSYGRSSITEPRWADWGD